MVEEGQHEEESGFGMLLRPLKVTMRIEVAKLTHMYNAKTDEERDRQIDRAIDKLKVG